MRRGERGVTIASMSLIVASMLLLIAAACTTPIQDESKEPNRPTPGGSQSQPSNLILDRSSGFSARYPAGWATWSYGWKAFIAPSLDHPLELRNHGLQGKRGFSMQISAFAVGPYRDYLRRFLATLDELEKAGASVRHSQLAISGRLSEQYHVRYPADGTEIFDADDEQFLRACASCEAEYTLIRWPSQAYGQSVIRIDSLAHADSSLAENRSSIDLVRDSLRAFEPKSLPHRFIALGPDDLALDALVSFMDSRIAGEGAERYLDPKAMAAYSTRRPLYWFMTEGAIGSYQILARVPIDTFTTRFEVTMSEQYLRPFRGIQSRVSRGAH